MNHSDTCSKSISIQHIKFFDRFYNRSEVNWDHLMFSNQDLWKLLFPLFLENMLTSFMGMADSMMVTRVGPAAISAVSLTDSINTLVIQLFQALAVGGAIVCSQYIGSEQHKKANDAARQLFLAVCVISGSVMLLCLLLRKPMLSLIFGSVEADVMKNAQIYFLFTSLSFPAIALFQVGAAFFRAGGNSKFSMTVSTIANAINIAGNAVFIFVFRWGVAGAALATLISRIFSAVVILHYLRRPKQPIVLRDYFSIRPDMPMIARLLRIGIPSGIENSMFQFGKLAIQSSVSTLGTTAIAANAMMIIFENINGIGGIAIGMGLMTVAGQCLGAGRIEETKYYIVKLVAIAEVVVLASCLVIFAAGKPIMILAGMEPEGMALCWDMLVFVSIVKPIVWVPSFITAYGMRAAGDVKFSMIVSSLTMWFCRVALTVSLIRFFHFGPIAVWIGMASDWAVRAVVFSLRYRSGRWLQHKVI